MVYLKRYPIDEIKIDRSFIKDIVSDLEDRAIVIAILAMSRSLGISVVAEGVENREQLAILQQHDCKFVQGYLFSKPMSEEAIGGLVQGGCLTASTATSLN